MAPSIDDDEFDLDDGDDDEMYALVEKISSSKPQIVAGRSTMAQTQTLSGISGTQKRRASDAASPSAKRVAVDPKTLALATMALTKNFGMTAFRLKQEQVISRVLGGGSATVIFPTGGGKSLCYQIPGILFPELDKIAGTRQVGHSGIALVISPLIALMKDQVDSLVRRGIKAATMDSTKTREEHLHTTEMIRNGELKLLYCAPERLNNEGFVEQMKYVRGGIRLLAVDEAHCISEWGHAFRPDYLKISRFSKEIKAERVICLTATATPRVATDICKAFDIDESAGLFRTSTYRSNLKLLAESGATKKELTPRLYKFLKQNPGPSIVYVTLQRQTEELAADLRKQGFEARAFHAGMEAPIKTALQEEFMRVNNLIIVATIAFGMGIDKSNIRNVVHFNLPSSVESYSQEIGRAGRDGNISNCVFYVCGEDLHLREMFARGDLPSKDSVQGLLYDIFNSDTLKLPVGTEFRRNLFQQGRENDIRPTTLSNIYAQLELNHHLIRATTPMYSKYSYKIGPQYNSVASSDPSPAADVILKYAKKASTLTHIDLDKASAASRIPRPDLVRKLNNWNEAKAIELKPSGVLNTYKILAKLPDTPRAIEKVVDEIYAIMEKREEDALTRAEQMLLLVTDERCFSLALAQHFGDSLPDGKTECGHCSWCLTHTVIEPHVPPPVPFNRSMFREILAKVPDRDDPRFLARIAFGISSPRVTTMKLSRAQIFGSMDDHTFVTLLREFTLECDKANDS